MQEENIKPVMVNIENYNGEKPIEVIYREDKPLERLVTFEAGYPEAFDIHGIISAPADWLEKRHMDIDHHNCRVEVARESGVIALIINERNCSPAIAEHIVDEEDYNNVIVSEILKRSSVTGSIEYTDIFRRLHINEDDSWQDPVKLSQFFRLNRSIFPDMEQNMLLVSVLKNIKAKINANYEKSKDTYTGSRTEFFQQEVEHNLPKDFDISIPIFKGSNAEKYNVEFDVDIVDGRILLQLKSPAINDIVQTSRDEIIDKELARIGAVAPEIVIIEK